MSYFIYVKNIKNMNKINLHVYNDVIVRDGELSEGKVSCIISKRRYF